MRHSDANPLPNPWIKLLACTAALLLALLLGAPRAHAITQCDEPCFKAYENCLDNCLISKGGTTCTAACSTQYNFCIAHVTCTPPTQPLPPDLR